MSPWRSLILSVLVAVCGCTASVPNLFAFQGGALTLLSRRQTATDLEVAGAVSGLEPGSVRYVTREQLARLPQKQAIVNDDPDLPGLTMRISGVPLDALPRALGADPASDLLIAVCNDGYSAYYPQPMIAAHQPILVLTIDGMSPHDWAAKAKQEDPGPYLVLYHRFKPAWKVLAHEDKPQLPANVVRLVFERQSVAFARIAPQGNAARTHPVTEGFQIAQQNCIRCHAQGATGGTKSGVSWRVLGHDARDRPAWFSRVVKDPKAALHSAAMPGNPEYDAQTLSALVAYYKTFAEAQ